MTRYAMSARSYFRSRRIGSCRHTEIQPYHQSIGGVIRVCNPDRYHTMAHIKNKMEGTITGCVSVAIRLWVRRISLLRASTSEADRQIDAEAHDAVINLKNLRGIA